MLDGPSRAEDPADQDWGPRGSGGEEAASAASERVGDLRGTARDRTPGDEGDLLAGLAAPIAGASVVMATVGRAELLPVVIDAVLADPACLELTVAVDGPDAESVAKLNQIAAVEPRLRVLTGPNRGQLGALDEAVRQARSDVVVLLDDDVVPGPGMISGHVRHHLAAGGLVVVGPMPVSAESATVATRLYASEYLGHIAEITAGDVDVLDAFWTGNVSLRRADCLRVGLRSASFSVHYHADRDLGYRLSNAGLTGRFDPSLVAAHLHERSDAAFLRDARKAGAGRVTLHRAHPERLGPFTPQLLVADLPGWLQKAVRGAASTRAADMIASWLMAAGRLLAKLHVPGADLYAAKLARRVAQYRGALIASP